MSIQTNPETYGEIAVNAWKRFASMHEFNTYGSILVLNGMARLGKIMKSDEIFEQVKERLNVFLAGGINKVSGAYDEAIYRDGGNATAWMLLRGFLPESREKLVAAAERLCNSFPRNADGIFIMPNRETELIWIDTVFAVCPFLLWVGLATGEKKYIDESVLQMLGHHKVLFNTETRLYHQARRDGKLSAFWGRGAGWGILALAELAYDLPEAHPGYQEVRRAFRDVMEGCLAVQDVDGMFHQCLDDPGSYPESSGTGLILYGLGRGIKNGSLDRGKVTEPFLRGMRGLSRYVALDGSVFNCCVGCLAPGEGTTAAYAVHPWRLNDAHAAGPVIYAYGQAEQLHRNSLIPSFSQIMEG